ncbi:serine/threonine-protein phosphatase 4 regulatory subunit 2-like [Macrosteles quadrilineatus]|uniref:serine/threonine-protein phosphatase 4 regulatory subunit 2-like n=1 Tax=Macrosteles quadrilineatus TaxID=74068 RepID=UPI0023E14BB8|nr:serine/threonine-protein phosphatase 4 regulatory subunit 2-like [Macrosteles quadrilineatus]
MQEIYPDKYNTSNMENAEDVMQLLEEFAKVKPKDIPKELEEYLGYVAKTGDPVFQWSLIRNLLREKLLAVVTDFYESTLTVELPPCPNVEPFNYDRMKTSLLERFDAFAGAPFTIQRICELLINPRKEYNRADKYMRAIEKNILVVSTREPGSGKRPLECDQSESILNGMPDVKLSESDGSLLHVPTDLPYFGAPPASNDVTIETTEPNSTITDRVGLSINGDASDESEKICNLQESHSSIVAHDTPQVSSRVPVDIKSDDVPLVNEVKNLEENDCDSNSRLSNVTETINPCSDTELESVKEMTSETSDAILPDSIDSSDSLQVCSESSLALKTEDAEVEGLSDENEVSSSPADPPENITNTQDKVIGTSNSEAEAVDSCLVQTDVNLSPDSDNSNNERVTSEEETQVSITEITATRSDEVDLECNEISGTVSSPASSDNPLIEQADGSVDNKTNFELVEECESTNSHPDSSNDLIFQTKQNSDESQKCETDLGSEADSISVESIDQSLKQDDVKTFTPDQTEIIIVQEVCAESSPECTSEETCRPTAETVEEPLSSSPVPTEEAVVSESPSSSQFKEDGLAQAEQQDVESTSDIVVEMYDNERRDESVIQSTSHIAQDSQEQITIEEISVDPTCDTDEAMDVDDGSNQMMVSEGENDGEPMDEGDQVQS